MTLLLVATSALAFEKRPAAQGETVADIALSLGDPSLEAEIRKRNALPPGTEPAPGQILTLPPPRGPHADQSVFIFSLVGRASSSSSPLRPFQPLPIGSEICTAADSYLSLRAASTCGDTPGASDDILLSEDTCVILESAFASSLGRSVLLRVVRGSVTVAPSETPGLVAVTTDSGLATGQRGGFRIHAERSAMRAEAVTGPLQLQGRSNALDLAIRTGSRIPLGGDPSPPVDLLPETALLSPTEGAPLRRPRFVWQPTPDAFAYLFEISSNEAFTAIVYAETVPDPEHTASLLLLPSMARERLWWRVASADRLGFLGVPTPPHLFLVP